MANPEHVELVKRGSEAIELWRRANPDARLDLEYADLTKSNLIKANLSRAILNGANLERAYLGAANLGEASLRGAMLKGADLGEAYLYRTDLGEAFLAGANLRGAYLHATFLRRAYLNRADLRKAFLTGANFREANLCEADLQGTYLKDVNLRGANLNGTNFKGVRFFGTMLCQVDLSAARNLDQTRHDGPSTIGIDTLYQSGGKISEAFLRGCGVPEDLITYIPSLLAMGIQFYSAFISYSHKDEEFAKRLHGAMQGEKLRVWFAPEEMKGGQKLHEQIFEGIRTHDKLLLVLSEQSMKSEWVATEIRRARKRERAEGNQILFPIRLVGMAPIIAWECFDADSGKDLAVEIREYYIPDFSNWKDHDSFQAEFAKLLRALENPREIRKGA